MKNILPTYQRNSVRTLEADIEFFVLERAFSTDKVRQQIADDKIIDLQKEYKALCGSYYSPKTKIK